MGNLTSALVKEMKSRNKKPLCIVDGYKESGSFEGIPVFNIEEVMDFADKEVSIIVTPISGLTEIYRMLNKHGIRGKVVPIWEIIGDNEITDRLKYLNKL